MHDADDATGSRLIDHLIELRSRVLRAIVGIFIVAAIITPPDVVSQLLLAIPMVLLYEVGIVAARMLARPERGG